MKKKAFLVVLLLCWPLTAWAVLPSEADYEKLRVDITQTHASEFQALVDAADYQDIADKYNLDQSPEFYVWRIQVSEKEIYETTIVDAPPTQTTWNWTTYKGQTVQERDSWVAMLRPGTINPSLPQTRAAYNSIFGGQGASAAQQQYLLAVSRRKALRIEALLVVGGSGNGSASTPATMGYTGQVSYADINHCLTGSPLP